MPDNIYDIIRNENLKKYGTDVARYGKTLLANLYSDRTHFIYEILQNTEDAYERARNSRIKVDSKIQFILYPDQLEVRHNGIPFNEDDVRGVCSIAEGTKSDDPSQIGKFGIGFQSVFAYTKSPQIFSEEKAFQINNYVHPHALGHRKDVKAGETLIVIPFNGDQIKKEDTFSEIENRLKDLDIRTPLFLKNILEISWKIRDSTGSYKKEINVQEPGKWVKLQYFENNKLMNEENWIIFARPLKERTQLKVEIAFFIENGEKSNKKNIVPVPDTFAIAYFPTSISTNLNFLVQAPFDTTPARDNIRENDWNKYLIQELGFLTAESISDIKKLKLLDYHFLQTLPLDTTLFAPYNFNFYPIFQQVKEKLSGDDPLLPTFDGVFTIAKNALLARGEKLRELFPPNKLCALLERKQAIWLDENITIDRTPDVRKYLMEELYIEEIDSERIAREFSEEFIEKQSDKWIVQFYSYLKYQEALWRKGQPGKPDGPLRSKEFIRCEDGTHVTPFKENGDPNVYLPSKFDDLFPIVKKTLLKDDNSKDFLEKLGLKEPDKIDGIIEKILPLYSNVKSMDSSEKEHLTHVEWIAKTISEIGNPSPTEENARKIELISKVKSTAFLYGHNNVTSEIQLKRPSELYLGKPFLGSNECEIFFEENPKIWFLDERYCNNSSLRTDSFELMGCKVGIQVNYRRPDYNNIVKLPGRKGHHSRGLFGFDPDSNIEGLEYCLDTINEKKSEIIWNLLKQHYNKIYGIVESSNYQTFQSSDKNFKRSNMGELLIEHPWLPNKDNDGVFFKPSDIQLVELPENFDIQCSEANRIAEKLGFKKDLEPPIYEGHPELKKFKSVIDVYSSLSEDKQKKALEMMQKLNEPEIKSGSASKKDIDGLLKKNLVREGDGETDPDSSSPKPNLTLEEEETIRQNFGKEFPNRLKRLKIAIQTTIQRTGNIIDSIEPRSFLFAEYDGHCQICYTKLDLGKYRKPFFEVFRIIKTEKTHEFTNMEFNVLCLCPNCHALMDHGTPLNLRNIFSKASLIRNGGIVSEWISEWNQDGYIIKIIVSGNEKEIFYSQAHMAKFPELEDGIKDE